MPTKHNKTWSPHRITQRGFQMLWWLGQRRPPPCFSLQMYVGISESSYWIVCHQWIRVEAVRRKGAKKYRRRKVATQSYDRVSAKGVLPRAPHITWTDMHARCIVRNLCVSVENSTEHKKRRGEEKREQERGRQLRCQRAIDMTVSLQCIGVRSLPSGPIQCRGVGILDAIGCGQSQCVGAYLHTYSQ